MCPMGYAYMYVYYLNLPMIIDEDSEIDIRIIYPFVY